MLPLPLLWGSGIVAQRFQRVVNTLFELVLCLQLALHIKVQLSLSLDALSLHIADNALMHSLWYKVIG